MNDFPEKSDARRSTRARLVAVYNRLLLDQASARPKVAELIDEAGVSRSTFYDHFDGIEALHDESLSIVMGRLADHLVDGADRQCLVALLDHFWANRAMAREMMTGEAGERIEGLLARLLEARIAARKEARLHAILIAGMSIAALSGWLRGQVAANSQALADRLVRSTNAILHPDRADRQ